MRTKITVLAENFTRRDQLVAEHGLSFLIEVDDKKILFDTGASDIFLKNAVTMGISLEDIDCVVLSHGHYDHVGGLEHLYNKKVYVHPDIFIPKFSLQNEQCVYAGFPLSKGYYENTNKLDFIKVTGTLALTPDIGLHANFAKTESNNFRIKVKDAYIPDPFSDELSLSINTSQGLVIITGCAHSGVINIIEKVVADYGVDDIYALLGGFHLKSFSEGDTGKIAAQINKYMIKMIGISHCTGDKLAKYLVNSKVFNFNVGDVFVC